MKDDLISRQAAIDAMTECYWSIMGDEPPKLDEKTALYVDLKQAVKRLPTADLSEYCDKLWKTAYEHGKWDAQKRDARPDIVHCKECIYYENETHGLCDLGGEWAPDDYCSYGRRPKHG